MLLALGVELADVLGVEGGGVLPDGFVVFVGECVFCVELKLVVVELGEFLDELLEPLEFGNSVATDVEHEAAFLEEWFLLFVW